MIPNFNRAIFEGLRIADREQNRPATPMVTILTDLADCPPHFWIERQDQYLICGTAKAAEQALAMGYPPRHVLRTSGMIVRPEFYARPEISREQERRRLGLRPELPTRPGHVRRIRIAPDADDRAARGRGRGEDPADLFVRA